ESQSLRSVWTRSPIAKPPTALTRTSIRPWRASRASARRAIAASSATSQRSSISRLRAVPSTEASSRSRSCATIHGTQTTALFEAFTQRRLEELVHASQDRRKGAAREALVLLVEQAECDQVRGLELEGPVLLGGGRLLGLGAAVHPDDLERLLLEVVRLLRVEREHLE